VNRITKILGLLGLLSLSVAAQAQPLQDPLLDHMVGKWVLQGTIDGKNTTHDVTAEWVLAHQYVRLHEVSREQTDRGQPQYEAIVFIGKDEPSNGYACLWLDSTGGGGLSAQGIAHARREADKIAFLFKLKTSIFHTTFVYSRRANTWEWLMDGEEGGKLQPFARVKLVAK
jgi:hypothetical protein